MSESIKVDLKKILSVSGYSGLFKFISQAKAGVIVESLFDKKRMCVSSSAKVSSLSDIAIYTDKDDVPLQGVFTKIKEMLDGKEAVSAKSTPDELKGFFVKALPTYDKDRVYVSHIKKIVEWYNLLQGNDMLDFEELEEEVEEKEKVEETSDNA